MPPLSPPGTPTWRRIPWIAWPTIALAWLALVAVGLPGNTARSNELGIGPPVLDLGGDYARVRAALPGLLIAQEQSRAWVVTEVDEAGLDELLASLRAGRWSEAQASALRLLFWGLATQRGVLATYGRSIMEEAVAAAGAAPEPTALEGLADLLIEVSREPANQYAELAHELLDSKVRCAAGSLAATQLIARVADEIRRQRGGELTRPSDIGDRYDLHAQANLFSVSARGPWVIAAGASGSVLVSTDGAQTWQTPPTGTDEALFATALGPQDDAWAVGRAGSVLYSSDRGATWSLRPIPFERHLFGVLAPAAGSALVVGDFGLQLRSQDRGERWTCLPRERDVILGRVAAAGSDAVIVGEFGTLERLPGGDVPGRQSQLVGVPEDTYLFDAWFDATGRVGIAVGLEGTLLRSEDGGATFRPAPIPYDADLYGVAGAGDAVVLVGEGGLIAYSTDGGRTFADSARPPLPLPYLDVAFADERRVYAVSQRGLILASDDAGASFRVVHGGAAP